MFRFLIFTSLSVCALGASLPLVPTLGIGQGPIVGGEQIDITEVPWQVATLYDSAGSGSYSLRCGGSIISESVIISAAHCVSGTSQSRWRIRAGSTSHNAAGQVIDSERFVFHSGYNSQYDYDIAIFFLANPLTLDGYVTKAIALPSQDQAVADGAPALVTGWGSTFSGGSVVTILRGVTIPVVNQDVCVAAYTGINPVTPRMICGGLLETGGQDACQGDSGGPFVVDNQLVGITSWGRGCAQAGYPGVWTRVAALRDWVDQQLA